MTRFASWTLLDRSSLGWRVLGWTLLVSGLGIAALLSTTIAAMHNSAEYGSNSEIVQEITEMRTFASSGVDPLTGKPFENASAFLRAYLGQQQPGRGEIFIAHTPATNVTEFRLGEEVDRAKGRALVSSSTVISTMMASQTGLSSSDLGPIRWARADIVRGDSSAHFVIVHVDNVRFSDQRRTMNILWPLALAALVASAAVAVMLSRFIIRPLRVLESDVSRIQDEDLTRRVAVTGNDEVAHLALAFNSLLDRLETSFSTQRQFLDDTGHELRTPITVVRGHLELLSEDPEERADTIALVLSELDRMNRLVTDLLVLAKAEQPDFIRCEPGVDVAQLTLDLDAKVMQLADRAWTVKHVAEGEAFIDAQRVTQAVVQLAQNAVQHTEDGDHISLSTEFGGAPGPQEWVEFRCADSGEGVSDEDKPRLFERFRRGGNTARLASGAGLGLAIVQAIAAGHGGACRVEDTPGGGATFVMRVPRHQLSTDDA